MKFFLVIMAAIFLVFYGVMANSFVLTKLWFWFVVPFNLPVLTLPWAMGLLFMVGLMKSHDYQTSDDGPLYKISTALFRPWFCLLFAYITKEFM